MRIAVIGTGYVGLVAGACLSYIGHEVSCIDIDQYKIKSLQNNIIPIYEPGLDKIVKDSLKNFKISFSSDYNSILDCSIVIIAVGTPTDEEGRANLSYIYEVLNNIKLRHDKLKVDNQILLIKSTVPVGTNDDIANNLYEYPKFKIASNPEFLREGSAVNDFLNPDRIIIGARDKETIIKLKKMYEFFEGKTEFLTTNPTSAEIIKYASNTFLATKVAFINELSRLCDNYNSNISDISLGLGLDTRIGKSFLNPGPGFGGSCFPKDIRALTNLINELNLDMPIVKSINNSNSVHRDYLGKRIIQILKEYKANKITFLGVTFKANTDDIRESASLEIIPKVALNNFEIMVYDPIFKEKLPQELEQFSHAINLNDAIKGSDAVIILTEWDDFKYLTPDDFKKLMIRPLVIDLRNLFKYEEMIGNEINYYCLGRLGKNEEYN